MTGAQVIKNALKYKNYVYWYGGKGDKCTKALLDRLASAYPNVYTASYKNKCLVDIKNGKYCIDCSGLVCKAYGISDIGTYSFPKAFKEWTGTPKNGMIVWTWTHTGIYNNGKVIEARGVDYDVTTSRTYRKQDWQRVFYSEKVNYMNNKNEVTAQDYLKVAEDIVNGKAGNGDKREAYIKAKGLDYDRVQKIVNIAVRGY